MRILAIETSCDETGIAIVSGENTPGGFVFTTEKAALLSQAQLHAQYGGVYPNLAKREHQKNLPIILEQVIGKFPEKKSSGSPQTVFSENFPSTIDGIAVTMGPGLEPALWQGIEFAKKLAHERQLPLVPINHMEGHLISSLVQHGRLENIGLPVLGLLISGGHTEFVLMKEWFRYEVIGETLDDAVGECFDKVARMLGLPYPGGPEISKLADQHRSAGRKPAGAIENQNPKGISSATARELQQFRSSGIAYPEDSGFSPKLPRPMLQSGNCDVSFSGLKTAALYALRDAGELTLEQKAAFAAEFEETVGDVFIAKTRRALQESGAKTFVIGGGVAANRYLRERLQQLVLDEFPEVEMRLPELSITGDNAVMIAQAALARLLSADWSLANFKNFDAIRAVGNLSIAS